MTSPEAVLDFWFQGALDEWRTARWFRPDAMFDAAIRARFGALPAVALAGGLAGWAETPRGVLALCLVLDQFPRNLHRGCARAFACDMQARTIARHAVLERSQDRLLPPAARAFLYLPFEHSEDLADQDLSCALFEGLRDSPSLRAPGGCIEYAWAHRAVVHRFGRFPHRNAALGRAPTPEEAAWLALPGSGF